MFSTSGGVQYIGGYHEYIGDVQYIGGYHDECGGYHEYIGGCSAHWRDTMSKSGGIMSTSGMFSTSEGYHDTRGGAT